MPEPKYKQISVIIQKSRTKQGSSDGFSITGHLEESFTYGISAEYQQPYANVLNNLANSIPFAGTILKTQPMTSPLMSANYWQGSETQDMQISIVLEAESDPLTEIRLPILNLLSLVAPHFNSGIGLLSGPISSLHLTPEEVKTITQAATTAASTVVKSATGTAGSVLEAASNATPDSISGLCSSIENTFNSVKQLVGQVTNSVIGTVNSVTEDISSAASNAISNAVQSAKSIVGSAASGLEKLADSAKALSSASSSDTAKSSSNSSSNSASAAPASVLSSDKPVSPTEGMMKRLNANISIKIGTYLYFPCVVVTNVTTNITHTIDAYSGWPMSAVVTITFRPMFTQAYGDVVAVFQDSVNPAVDDSYIGGIDSSMSENNTLTSTITGPITNTIKTASNSVINTASNIANSVTKSVSASASNISKSISGILPFGD